MNRDEIVNQRWSFIGVVLLALILPGMLKLVNSVTRNIAGAEGRLAAITIDTDRTLGPMAKNWLAMSQGGENLKGFVDASATMLEKLRPEYIRIDHIYDEFGIVTKNGNGFVYNWNELDTLVNKITAMGAKPFFSLSYMPREMSVDGDILSEPKNWNDWADLVQKTIEHYSGTLGIDGVYYEVWNEPDLFGKWTMGGKKDYKSLYAYSVYGARQAANTKSFKIGGVATTGLYRNWVDAFFPYVLQNKLRLDFFSWHRYDADPERYAEDINNLEKWIGKHPYFDKTERIISETGPRSEAGGINDTSEGAAHLITIARELLPRVKYGFNFAIWGNWGVMGKPRQTALEYLTSLGNERLPITGEGSWVKAIAAKNGVTYQVILVNYDKDGTHSENVPVTFINVKGTDYSLAIERLGGEKWSNNVATDSAIIQTRIQMPPNSVVKVELLSKSNIN